MQPNEQPGSQQPVPGQTVPPVVPPQPVQPGLPVQPAPFALPVQPQPPVQPVGGPVDPAGAVQAALNGPVITPAPQQPPVVTGGPADGTDDEEEEEEGADDEPVTWTAHEAIHQEKGTMWFVLFTVLMLAFLGLSIWTQAWTFAVLVVVITIVVFIFAKRPPRELTYSLTEEGLTVDGRLHDLKNFKAFGVIHDGEDLSVMLIPTQRFQPGLTVYFPEELGDDIVDILGSSLPMKELHLDMVDRAVRFFRL